MAQGILLQDWITIRATNATPIIQRRFRAALARRAKPTLWG
jgi:hypothetical protein